MKAYQTHVLGVLLVNCVKLSVLPMLLQLKLNLDPTEAEGLLAMTLI